MEVRDLLLLGLGGLLLLLLARLPRPGGGQALPVDRASLEMLVKQLAELSADRDRWRRRAESAERYCDQLLEIIDWFLLTNNKDHDMTISLQEELQRRNIDTIRQRNKS